VCSHSLTLGLLALLLGQSLGFGPLAPLSYLFGGTPVK
jgi:hypothetical protein